MSSAKATIAARVNLSDKEGLAYECQKYGYETVSDLIAKIIENRHGIYAKIHDPEMGQNGGISSVNADDFLNKHTHPFTNSMQNTDLQSLTSVNVPVNAPANAVNSEQREVQLMQYVELQEKELNALKKEHEELRLFSDFLQGLESCLNDVLNHAADLANEVHFFPRDYTAEYFIELLQQKMTDESTGDS